MFGLLFTITSITDISAAGHALVASASTGTPNGIAGSDVRELPEAPPPGAAEADAAPEPDPEPAAPPAPPIGGVAPSAGGQVLASWYGPGFYGNRTACGQTFTPELLGVAHLTLPCGSLVTLTHGGRSVTVPVIDRGPYVAGRTLDLSAATKGALGCTDLCTVFMRLGR